VKSHNRVSGSLIIVPLGLLFPKIKFTAAVKKSCPVSWLVGGLGTTLSSHLSTVNPEGSNQPSSFLPVL
jgi:hypothetical protein